jgi:hypothetical protein
MDYKVKAKHDGFVREYHCHSYYDATMLFHILTRELPYVELWEMWDKKPRMVQKYDNLTGMLA